ncbi:serine hydrolase [Flavobacterium aestivum]|uniref:serine hydrolase n=1 Tax=Flavobacterium aestivum TaxID=3003257 RepID=UPI0022865C43|nr:serine hydrolase [Flavobacterium aestivum]
MKKTLITLFAIIASLHSNAQEFDKKIESLIDKATNLYRFNGTVLVSKKGKILLEKGYGFQDIKNNVSNTPNTIYQVGSTTKQFTSAVILKLAEQNKLTLDDKISKYFPEFKFNPNITIKHLLTHTSGLPEIFRDPLFLKENKQLHMSKEKMLSFYVDKPLYFEPGTQYSYCNSGYQLLGLISEKITGKPYELNVRELILKPLKMNHSGFDFSGLNSTQKATGYSKYSKNKYEQSIPWDSTVTYSAGALYTTAHDLYLWHEGLLNNKVLKKSTLKEAYTPFLEGYGLGCFIDTLYEKKVISHGGNIEGFTSYFGRIEEDDVCVILLNNIYNTEIESIGTSILAILYDKPYRFFEETKISDDVLEKYVGDYEINTDYHIKIARIDNQLFAQIKNEPKIQIFADKENSFFVKEEDIRVKFKVENGKVIGITVYQGLSTKKGDKII